MLLHPDFPVIENHHQLTKEWSVMLPGKFNRRLEDGDLVIWRPGFTIWTAVWNNVDGKSREECLAWIKQDISEGAFDLVEERQGHLLRLRYRLAEDSDDSRVLAYYCFAISDRSHVQMAMYFDEEADLDHAEQIWKSLNSSLPGA